MVNGVGVDEPYINADSPLDLPASADFCGARRFTEVVVPQGHLFVMGDNRAVSMDSRCQGTVPIDNVIGRAFMIVWPAGRWDTLSVPDTFRAVPDASAAGAVAPNSAGPGGDAGAGALVVLPVLASLVGSSRPRLWSRSRARRLRR
jgi:signal peptidase I